MIVSRNEVHGVVRKAALGAGLPGGTADDFANAASWVEARGLAGLPLALNGIQSNESGGQGYAAVFDRIAAGETPVQTEHANLLLVGFAAGAAVAYDLGFVIEWAGCRVDVGPNGYLLTGDDMNGPASVSAGTELPMTPKLAEIVVDANIWARANKMAAAYYVPATDASRLGGAGAGVNDND